MCFVHTFRLRTRIEFVTRSRIEVYTNVGIPMYLRKHTRATRPFTYPSSIVSCAMFSKASYIHIYMQRE